MIELFLISMAIPLDRFFKKPVSNRDVIEAMLEKRREHNIEIIRQSIRSSLEPIAANLGRDFTYYDILHCAKSACWTTDWETKDQVNEALKKLGLSREDFP